MIALPDRHQVIDICRLVALEIVRKIQCGLYQQSLGRQIERYHQAPQASVAVQKRVDRFELVVPDRDAHQRVHIDVIGMQECLQIAHQVRHMIVVWRNEDCVLEAHADPVLAFAELPRLLMFTSNTGHQDFVGLAQQAIGQGQLPKRFNREIDCLDVVLYLRPIVALFRIQIIGILERVLDVGLRTLDPARLRGFLGHIHADEELDVRDQLGKSVQFSKRTIGAAQKL